MNIHLQRPQPPFTLWKWIVFGSLFLLALNYVSSLAHFTNIVSIGIGLGFMIMARTLSMKKLAWGLRLLSGLGLSLLISFIASTCLYGLCAVKNIGDLCTPNHLRASIFANFIFSNIIIVIWIAIELLLAIGKNIAYVFRYKKG
jgi:hypothetical protein